MFMAIHSGEHHPVWEGENFDFDVEHDPREFDAKNLRIPRTGHRGIRGISTVARGRRGGLGVGGGGRLHGADERMRRNAFGAVALGEKGWEGKNGEISRDVESGSKGGMEGIRGGSAPLGRQLGGETAEAGERLGESIRMAVRGDKRGPTK